ncbi:MAG TPA: GNAT family N-acetyltransferase [Bacillales bacterium]|nr:GNAT family N-acetyltransferase [Bacillales bacterium]
MFQAKIVSNDQEYKDAVAVRRKVFVYEQKVPESLEIDEHESNAIHFVVYDGIEPIGAGRCRESDNYYKVERICVLPSRRKQGIGMKIMKKIEEYAKEHGATGLKLNSQTHAVEFYQRLGYLAISEEFMEAGIPHIAMKKPL